MSSTSSELVSPTRFSDDQLRSINSLGDALALVREQLGADPVRIDQELGNGFAILPTNDKGRLVGVGFVILDWRHAKGDNGDFSSAVIVTEKGEKLIVNDGSTGLHEQLVALGDPHPVAVRRGLRRSDYTYTDEKTGEEKSATTFYLDTSA